MFRLRPYQEEGIKEIYSSLKEGYRSILYVAATGSGKSVLFSYLIKDAYNFSMNVVLVVKRRSLIFQASKHLDNWSVPHSICMSDHPRFDITKRVQVCSIDTLSSRDMYPHVGENTLVLGDECHDFGSRTYQTFLDHYKMAYIVGFTATPYADNSMFDKLICPIDPWDLMKQGYLVPDKTFVPTTVDTSKVKVRAGEFVNKDLEDACSDSFVVGDIVKSWKTYAQNLRTVLFAVNIKHSKLMCKAFNDSGIPAIHCDAKSSQEVREDAIKRLVNRDIKVLCNVNIFSTGVDIPEIECIDFCRPTHSLIYWIQAVGRGLRPSPGKKDCLILDHAGNTYRHGGVYLPRQILLEKIGSGKISEENEIEIRTCDECFYIYQGDFCPMCGFKNKNKDHVIKVKEGKLKEYTLSDEDIHQQRVSNFYAEYHKLSVVARRKGFKTNWTYYQLLKRYDKEFCAKYGKRIDFPNFLIK